jgi:uncharacterized protein (TIGR03663 family)
MRMPVPRRHLPTIAILLIAAVLRIWALEIKPPHFDEGINGWFADRMVENGYYRYDPTNYHGPLHFYAVFASQRLFGRELWALRLPSVAAGLFAVAALLSLGRFVGRMPAGIAAFCMAVSPAYVFHSRYSIHEMWQVLFCILLLRGILDLWQTGSRRGLFTLAASLAGLVLTKETYLLHAGCFALAAGVLLLWQRLLPPVPPAPWAERRWTREDALVAAGIAGVATVFFYSGTFHDFSLLRGLVETHIAWTKTGIDSGGHEKTAFDLVGPLNYYFIALMARYEWPAIAGLLACFRYILPSPAPFRYISIVGGGTLLAYSIIPYKTPWCVASMIWPFLLVLGGLAAEVRSRLGTAAALLPVAALAAVSLVSSISLNFFRHTDETEPYVYVQTYPDIRAVTEPLLKAARHDERIHHLPGVVMLDSYYPLPWILGDFTRVAWHPKDATASLDDPAFVIVDSSREEEIEAKLGKAYHKIPFRLRSGQDDCTAYLSPAIFQRVDTSPPTPPRSARP